jgi:transposase
MAEVEVESERIDDVPLLIHQQQEMGIAQVMDENIRPHWRRQGLSVGRTVMGWLSFIVSASDHRLSYVEPWAQRIEGTLRQLLGDEVAADDFNDDRLGDILRYLSDDEDWAAIERQLGQRLIRVYQLPQASVRLDSTSVVLYHDPEGTTLVRRGYSKDHRPDLGQLKVMLAGLEPLGLPLVTQVVPGNQADDGLYVPAIKRVRAVTGQEGLLYQGDSKMEALATRAHLVAGGDYYLLPLSLKGAQSELLTELVQPVWEEKQKLEDVYRQNPDTGERTLIAQGYETSRRQEAIVDGQLIQWPERVLVVYSPHLVERAYQGLQERLQRAEEKLLALTPPPGRGKRQYDELGPLQMAAEAVGQQHRVTELLSITYERQVSRRTIRPYQQRPARTEESVRYQIHVSRNEAAITQAYRTLGWRLLVLNVPAPQMSLPQAVIAYRGAPLFERDFARLKGRPLGLRPAYVQRGDHLVGLVRLLSLALSLLTLTEFVARRTLQAENDSLPGLYPGNPKQRTARPTAERLLAAFKDITLTRIHLPGQVVTHFTPLTPLQSRVLALLGLPSSIYSDLAVNSLPNPP